MPRGYPPGAVSSGGPRRLLSLDEPAGRRRPDLASRRVLRSLAGSAGGLG